MNIPLRTLPPYHRWPGIIVCAVRDLLLPFLFIYLFDRVLIVPVFEPYYGLRVLMFVAICALAYILVVAGWPQHIFLMALRHASFYYLLILLLVLYAYITHGGTWPWRPPSANMLAAIFNLLLMPTLAEFIMRPRWPRLIWITAALATIFLTSSRGGWLGLVAGLVTLMVMHRATCISVWRRIRPGWPLITLLAGVVGWLGWLQLNLAYRGGRWEFWSLAWQMFLRSPITGTGPGTFSLAWAQVYPDRIPSPHANSLICTVAAEQGIIGLAALVVVAVYIFRAVRMDAGMLAALVAFSAHNLVDTMTYEPAITFTLALLLGATMATKPHLENADAE